MVTRRQGFNFFHSRLAAQVGDSDTSFELQSVAGLDDTYPFYIVINPESQTSREVILIDGTISGETLSTSDLSNRYLDGSAQSTGLTHDADSPVEVAVVKQYVDDIYESIESVLAQALTSNNVSEVQTITESDYNALSPPDPETLYIVTEE